MPLARTSSGLTFLSLLFSAPVEMVTGWIGLLYRAGYGQVLASSELGSNTRCCRVVCLVVLFTGFCAWKYLSLTTIGWDLPILFLVGDDDGYDERLLKVDFTLESNQKLTMFTNNDHKT
ncbi:uncharacterized protein BO87DRAFT_390328 [Aspergillus neoniger CBS 115656]|uniref:Uncharacterized protein n=1 Tax=Aspergillus neoniger (strain CBS 115656) TaxID=1448310 RepID=A0A318Y798_ASPNB|nr:hypothetical protein BO87DRAFT_390328 [Aspergillus neoniger CBS 115656]PYH30155.1 hypothetical protein BO87DRAFT_390328 [Aspergillus neoniger CBS 115656]